MLGRCRDVLQRLEDAPCEGDGERDPDHERDQRDHGRDPDRLLDLGGDDVTCHADEEHTAGRALVGDRDGEVLEWVAVHDHAVADRLRP